MNKIKWQNRNRLIDAGNRVTSIRGKGAGGLGERSEGSKQRKHPHRQTIVW